MAAAFCKLNRAHGTSRLHGSGLPFLLCTQYFTMYLGMY